MFLFSFQLMNRSIDRWFSPNTSQLREDSTRVVLELAQYVTSNARGEAESIAATGALDGDHQHWKKFWPPIASRSMVDLSLSMALTIMLLASFQAPSESNAASLIPWLPENADATKFQSAIPLPGPLSEKYPNLGPAQ